MERRMENLPKFIQRNRKGKKTMMQHKKSNELKKEIKAKHIQQLPIRRSQITPLINNHLTSK